VGGGDVSAARVENNEVPANLDGVNQTIADDPGRITPTRTLPHQGGGELIGSHDGGLRAIWTAFASSLDRRRW